MSSFPVLFTLILASAKISEAAVVCFIMPFVNRMVAGFYPGTPASESARYSGIIESSLIVSEAIMAPLWGSLADKSGRKPLLFFGLGAFALASVAIGFSRNLFQAVAARCLSGILAAVAILVRTVQFEITDSSHVDKVLEWLGPCWAIGGAIGPMIGGPLAEPAQWMPSVFKGGIFDKFPYLLPSVVTAILPASAAVAVFLWLPETRGNAVAEPRSDQDQSQRVNQATEVNSLISAVKVEQTQDTSMIGLLRNPRLFYTLYCSAMLSFVSMAYNAAFLMMAGTSIEQGGLGLEPSQMGLMLGFSSGLGIVIATRGIPILVKRMSWYKAIRVTAFFHVILFPLIMVTGVVAQYEQRVGPLTGLVIFLVLVTYEIAEQSFIGLDVAIADRAPKGCLATMDGVSSTAQSVGRMIAPVLAGQLWSICLEMHHPSAMLLTWIVFEVAAIFWWFSVLRLDSPLEHAVKFRLADLESGLGGESQPPSEYGSVDDLMIMTPSESEITLFDTGLFEENRSLK